MANRRAWLPRDSRILTFTLDTNCLIDVEEDRPEAKGVRSLLAAQHAGKANVALVASSASERQRNGGYLACFSAFTDRANALGFQGIEILLPIGRWDIGFWDRMVWADQTRVERQRQVFETMFPTTPLDPPSGDPRALSKWRNRVIDAEAFEAHQHHGRAVFVTSNMNDFRKLLSSPDLPNARIMPPTSAVELLPTHL